MPTKVPNMAMLREEDVEQYLLDNTHFLENWLKKHGTPELLQRIKNMDVDKLAPAFNTSARNSITSNMFKNYVDGVVHTRSRSVVQRDKLLAMNDSELFMELIRDIASELDVNVLCHKILRNVSVLTGSDRGSLFLVRGSKDKRYLVSKLFDVTENSTLEDSLHTEETEIKVPFGRGIAGAVAETKEIINIKDAYMVGSILLRFLFWPFSLPCFVLLIFFKALSCFTHTCSFDCVLG